MKVEESPVVIPPDALVNVSPDAVGRQAAGILAEAEAKKLTTTSFNLSKEESAAIDAVVGNPSTLYDHRGDFIRHAVIELLTAWLRAGFPDDYVDDLVAHIASLRNAAYRLRLRQTFGEVLDVYESTIEQAMAAGDWPAVVDTLKTLRGYIDRTPDKYWKEHLHKTISKSRNVQHAISALYELGREEPPLKKEAETWERWLESLQT